MSNEKWKIFIALLRGQTPHRNTSLRLPIIADSFHWTTEQRFLTGGFLFLGERLFVDKRITIVIAPHKIVRRRIAANIAVDARGIDVVGAGGVFFHTLVSVRQIATPEVRSQRSEIRGQKSEVRSQKSEVRGRGRGRGRGRDQEILG